MMVTQLSFSKSLSIVIFLWVVLLQSVCPQPADLGIYANNPLPWNDRPSIRSFGRNRDSSRTGFRPSLRSFDFVEAPIPWYSSDRSVSVFRSRRYNGRPQRRSVAQRVMADMDLSVSPCVDFYQFSCGGYIRRMPDQNGVSQAFYDPKTSIDRILVGAMEESIRPWDIRALKQAKVMYRLCMDLDGLEYNDGRDLRTFIEELGGWPLLGSRVQTGPVLADTLAKVRRIHFTFDYSARQGVLVGLSIQSDYQRKGKYAIYLDEPTFGQRGVFGSGPTKEQYRLPRNDIFFTAYTRYIYELSVALGAQPDQAWQEAQNIVDLEIDIVKNGLAADDRRDLTSLYRKCTIRTLMTKYPQFDWFRYISKVTAIPGSNNIVTMESEVYFVKHFFDRLFEVMSHYSERTIANYVVFRGLQPLLPAMSQRFRDITNRYEATLSGVPRYIPPPRNVTCTNYVNEGFAWLTGRIFVQRGYSPEKQHRYKDITAYIRRTFTNLIARADGLSTITKDRMLDKMLSIKDKIGFPDYIFDDAYINNFYRNHRVHPSSLLASLRTVKEQNFVQNSVVQLVNPQPDRWIFAPGFVNAFSPTGPVAIEMYAAILDQPFFSLDYPASMNFGGIGFLVAHEYGHQFDRRGINVNKDGKTDNLLSLDISRRYYNTRTSCIRRQYNNYYIPAARSMLNGDLTLTENMADIVGLKAGYRAFKEWQSRSGSSSRVQGLPFTGDQLYFINNARIWCAKFSPQYERRWHLSDGHSLNRFRVHGPVENSKEFSDAFNCPRNTPMNPVNKCSFL